MNLEITLEAFKVLAVEGPSSPSCSTVQKLKQESEASVPADFCRICR